MRLHVKLVGILVAATAVLAAPVMASIKASGISQDAAQEPRNPEAIARLIAVWGFVKYHHNDARDGLIAMDAEFFGLYPEISKVTSLEEADGVLERWLVNSVGQSECTSCAEDSHVADIAQEAPTLRWLDSLPPSLSAPLADIYRNRSSRQANFQISPQRGTRQPRFDNENDYSATSLADNEATRMLALARQWNVLRYWFPYRDVMDESPHVLLPRAVKSFLAAQTTGEFHRALAKLAAASDDGHGGVPPLEASYTPQGQCRMPYSWRFVEERLVIDGRVMPADRVLRRGDVVTAIDGEAIAELEAQYGPYIATSNPSWFRRWFATILIKGDCRAHQLEVERGGETMTLSLEWKPEAEAGITGYEGHGRKGEVIQTLESAIAYVRIRDLNNSQLPQLFEIANTSEGLILDLRGYPRGFFVYNLGAMMVDEPTEFVRMKLADYATPGRFTWSQALRIQPDPDGRRITVPVVVLVDEAAISKPEFHAMAFRAAGATIIGSQTAGADGDVSQMPLPNGARMRFSGLGVFYPDKSPTQRIGIVPDIEVKPTIAGIAQGRDEVLERAVEHLNSLKTDRPKKDRG